LSNGAELHPDMIVVAAGLQTPDRLSRSAGLEWDNGIVVNPVSLRTCVPGIYAIGDCASIAGKVSRFIEPIARQALTIASQIHGEILLPYADLPLPVRVKTTSYPITVR
jgi:rubredoxin-NAD+ reductase